MADQADSINLDKIVFDKNSSERCSWTCTGLSAIYIKHNMFHKSKLGRDIELQDTHIVLFKSPRDVMLVGMLSVQLGHGTSLVD